MIKQHISASLRIDKDAFEEVPFNQKGGLIEAYELFGDNLDIILNELNELMTA